MDPQIQYAQARDGVSIAFWTLGEGPPLVMTPAGPFGNIRFDWEVLAARSWYLELAKERTVIRYDGRGHGMSDIDVADRSLEAALGDLDAVVRRLGLERFDLYAAAFYGPVAIAYAAQNPELVSRLILWCAAARGADFMGSPRDRALRGLMEVDWELYTETVSHLVYGWSAGEVAGKAAARLRETQTPATFLAANRALVKMDAVDFLSQVRCPTLVIHRRQLKTFEAGVPRGLASRIPDARLTLLEGDAAPPYIGDSEAVLDAVNGFLGPGTEPPAAAAPDAGAFRTILFTDVEESTALNQRLGDAKAREELRSHEAIVRQALKAHGGSEVKTMGDGFMASFNSATKALECAVTMQRAFAAHNEAAQEPLQVRIGLNAGEPIAEEEDLFGTAVIRAARITAMAQGGEILVANVVRELAEGKDFLFADRGEAPLRGFDDPVRLYEVRWRVEDSPGREEG
jgi:class 3 adenylate cyclase